MFRMFHSSADNFTSRVEWMFRGGRTCKADGPGSILREEINFCFCFFFLLSLSRPQMQETKELDTEVYQQ